MSNVFQFYQAGTLVVDLMQWPYFVTSMTFNGPATRVGSEDLSYSHGQRTLYSRYNNVAEDVVVFVAGDTQEDVSANVKKLERVLHEAITTLNDYGDKVIIKVQPSGVLLPFRSSILDAGILESENRYADIETKLLASTTPAAHMAVCHLVFTREYFWEAWDEVAIPLANTSSAKTTGWLQVYGHNDSDVNHDNYATIVASDVDGSIPAPIRLLIKNTGTDPLYNIWVGHNGYFSPLSFEQWLEAENATKGTGVSEISGSYSNGKAVTTLHSDSTEHKDLTWTISSTQLGYCRGRWFKILASIITVNSTSCKMRLKVTYSSTVLQETSWVLVNQSGIADIGTIKLPPLDIGGDITSASLNIELWTYGSSYDIDIDGILIMPAEEPDGVTHFIPLGAGVVYTSIMCQDGPNDIQFSMGVDEVSAGLANYVRVGPPVSVLPNRDQQLYFIWSDLVSGASEGWSYHTHTAQVKALYRQRRLKL